jgi:hypothetical protein
MTNLEIGQKAAEIAREEVLKEAKRARLSTRKVFKRIAEGLDAHETKTSYDKDAGQWAYSKKLIAHKTRLEAAALAVVVLGLKPNEKHDVNLNQPIVVEVVKFNESSTSK